MIGDCNLTSFHEKNGDFYDQLTSVCDITGEYHSDHTDKAGVDSVRHNKILVGHNSCRIQKKSTVDVYLDNPPCNALNP